MKRNYNRPTLKVVNVKPARILAGSPQATLDTKTTQITLTSDIGARGSRYSTWEDDAAAEDYDNE